MKRFSMFLLLTTFIVFHTCGQNKCNCEALIDWQFSGEIHVFDKPEGKIIGSMANDSTNENYLILTINEVQNDYFKVSLSYSDSEITMNGWIKKSKYIGTYARNYIDNVPLNLYSQPDKESKVESIVKTWIPKLYVIDDCKGDWVKVTMTYEGKKYTGWLEKEMQCANPYTTCN